MCPPFRFRGEQAAPIATAVPRPLHFHPLRPTLLSSRPPPPHHLPRCPKPAAPSASARSSKRRNLPTTGRRPQLPRLSPARPRTARRPRRKRRRHPLSARPRTASTTRTPTATRRGSTCCACSASCCWRRPGSATSFRAVRVTPGDCGTRPSTCRRSGGRRSSYVGPLLLLLYLQPFSSPLSPTPL